MGAVRVLSASLSVVFTFHCSRSAWEFTEVFTAVAFLLSQHCLIVCSVCHVSIFICQCCLPACLPPFFFSKSAWFFLSISRRSLPHESRAPQWIRIKSVTNTPSVQPEVSIRSLQKGSSINVRTAGLLSHPRTEVWAVCEHQPEG